MGQEAVSAGQVHHPATPEEPAHPAGHLPGFKQFFPGQRAGAANCPGQAFEKRIPRESRQLFNGQTALCGFFHCDPVSRQIDRQDKTGPPTTPHPIVFLHPHHVAVAAGNRGLGFASKQITNKGQPFGLVTVDAEQGSRRERVQGFFHGLANHGIDQALARLEMSCRLVVDQLIIDPFFNNQEPVVFFRDGRHGDMWFPDHSGGIPFRLERCFLTA